MISMCRDWPGFRLAPEPANHIREFPIHGYVGPTLLHPYPNCKKSLIFMSRPWPRGGWRPNQPHSGVSYTRISGALLAPYLPELKELVEFPSSVMAPRTLAPEPAAFGRSLHTVYVEPALLPT